MARIPDRVESCATGTEDDEKYFGPYQMRRSGPSIDLSLGMRTLAEAQKRCQWSYHSTPWLGTNDTKDSTKTDGNSIQDCARGSRMPRDLTWCASTEARGFTHLWHTLATTSLLLGNETIRCRDPSPPRHSS